MRPRLGEYALLMLVVVKGDLESALALVDRAFGGVAGGAAADCFFLDGGRSLVVAMLLVLMLLVLLVLLV